MTEMEPQLAAPGRNDAAFMAMFDELDARYHGRWVVFHEGIFAGDFDTFFTAVAAAWTRFGRGPYLVKQVGKEFLQFASLAAWYRYLALNCPIVVTGQPGSISAAPPVQPGSDEQG